jgi:hypothetical protein
MFRQEVGCAIRGAALRALLRCRWHKHRSNIMRGSRTTQRLIRRAS